MIDRDQQRQFIADSNWFAGAPDDLLDRLSDTASTQHHTTNSFIWTAGQRTTDVYGLLSGRLRISMTGEMGQEFALIDWEPGSWLGEQTLCLEEPNVLEVRALVPSDLLVLPRRVVLEVGEAWPALYRNLFQANWANVRGMYELLRGQLFFPLKARLAGRLLLMIEEHGHRVADGVLIDRKLSQNDFARLSMGSRQRVNRIFREWDRQGLVQTRDDHLLIMDIEGLQRETLPFE